MQLVTLILAPGVQGSSVLQSALIEQSSSERSLSHDGAEDNQVFLQANGYDGQQSNP
jgi:hypothetical protein